VIHSLPRCQPIVLSVLLLIGFVSLSHAADAPAEQAASAHDKTHDKSKATLGQMLFFDPALSKNRTMSCATCHAPGDGFVDKRKHRGGFAASLGDDGQSIGDRNAPSVGYASFSPKFHRKKDGKYVGGQFWDGRAANLAEQAGGPPLNPIEMGMPNKRSVVDRLKENPVYVQQFKGIYGETVFQNPDHAYDAMTDAIATFEDSEFFSPFDSKYDRFLRGEVKLTPEEELGRTLFFSQQFTNCNLCHQLRTTPNRSDETFTNYEYHNIGVPANTALRQFNGMRQKDFGLRHNPHVNDDPAQSGKHKVPTLRNVAVTGPYMHNGVFEDLRTVILFYNKYNSKSAKRQINPETGEQWRAPEVAENLSLEELETGPALDNRRIDALVAFLKTLTDQRYEPLLKQQEAMAKHAP
jgi:cytochrome c peroxidase